MPIKPRACFAGIGILLPKAVVNNPSIVLRSHRSRQADSLAPGLAHGTGWFTGQDLHPLFSPLLQWGSVVSLTPPLTSAQLPNVTWILLKSLNTKEAGHGTPGTVTKLRWMLSFPTVVLTLEPCALQIKGREQGQSQNRAESSVERICDNRKPR